MYQDPIKVDYLNKLNETITKQQKSAKERHAIYLEQCHREIEAFEACKNDSFAEKYYGCTTLEQDYLTCRNVLLCAGEVNACIANFSPSTTYLTPLEHCNKFDETVWKCSTRNSLL